MLEKLTISNTYWSRGDQHFLYGFFGEDYSSLPKQYSFFPKMCTCSNVMPWHTVSVIHYTDGPKGNSHSLEHKDSSPKAHDSACHYEIANHWYHSLKNIPTVASGKHKINEKKLTIYL
jgi:hypothetical protein